MAWRGLHLTNPSRLSLADGQIIIKQDDADVRLALEDIAWIVMDTPQAQLSSALLSACMESGIVIVITDAQHLPSGMVLPFHRHFRQADVGRLQTEISAPLKKRLWQLIVQRKIENQAGVLTATGRSGATVLIEMAKRVGSGDPDNVEARAARHYWGNLFDGFIRDDETDRRNMLLNYGYAVMRAGVARALVAYGFLPALGLFHASVSNAFNLADDIIEPFRPFVDLLADKLAQDGTAKNNMLTVEDRRAMAGMLLREAQLGSTKYSETVSLLVATERAAASLVRAMETGSVALLELPILVSSALAAG
jgi:CRISPR-associated protein Cas1